MSTLKVYFIVVFYYIFISSSFSQNLGRNDNEKLIECGNFDFTVSTNSETKIIAFNNSKSQKKSNFFIFSKDSVPYPSEKRDWKRLRYATSIYAASSIVVFGVTWALPESFTNWNKEKIKEKGFLWKWKRNVTEGPVMDKDHWVLNWITHPYSGGIYYLTSRSAGFTKLESFGYSTLMSTVFWEYGVESFAERPSIQDLIITPVVGSIVGEGFFLAKKSILRNDKKVFNSKFWGGTTLFLIDPFNTIIDGLNYKKKVKAQMNLTPVGINYFSKNPILGVQLSARF